LQQEENESRDRDIGGHKRDNANIAFTQIDESPVARKSPVGNIRRSIEMIKLSVSGCRHSKRISKNWLSWMLQTIKPMD